MQIDTDENVDNVDRMQDLLIRISARPLSTEVTPSRFPPNPEQIEGWWDEIVEAARKITGVKYR